MVWNPIKAISNWYTNRTLPSRKPLESKPSLLKRLTGAMYENESWDVQYQNQEWKKRNISKFKTREEYKTWKLEKFGGPICNKLSQCAADTYSTEKVTKEVIYHKGTEKISYDLEARPKLYWKARNTEFAKNRYVPFYVANFVDRYNFKKEVDLFAPLSEEA